MASSDPAGGQGRDPRLLLLNPADHVVVARQAVAAEEALLLDRAWFKAGSHVRLGWRCEEG